MPFPRAGRSLTRCWTASLHDPPSAPHSLFDRSILFAPDKRITAQSRQVNNEAEIHVAVDGGECSCPSKPRTGWSSPEGMCMFPLSPLPDKDFYEILNQKLMFRGNRMKAKRHAKILS